MVSQQNLTIKELLNEMKILEIRLIKLAEKYNRSLINVSAITYKDIVTSGGCKGDIMLNKIIKKEEIQNEFDIVMESYNEYKEETIKEIRKMMNEQSIEYCIVYFRDNLRWRWNDIGKLFSYSLSQCHRLYKKGKMTHNDTQ